MTSALSLDGDPDQALAVLIGVIHHIDERAFTRQFAPADRGVSRSCPARRHARPPPAGAPPATPPIGALNRRIKAHRARPFRRQRRHSVSSAHVDDVLVSEQAGYVGLGDSDDPDPPQSVGLAALQVAPVIRAGPVAGELLAQMYRVVAVDEHERRRRRVRRSGRRSSGAVGIWVFGARRARRCHRLHADCWES